MVSSSRTSGPSRSVTRAFNKGHGGLSSRGSNAATNSRLAAHWWSAVAHSWIHGTTLTSRRQLGPSIFNGIAFDLRPRATKFTSFRIWLWFGIFKTEIQYHGMKLGLAYSMLIMSCSFGEFYHAYDSCFLAANSSVPRIYAWSSSAHILQIF